MSSISLQDLNKRFYATGMYGKLLNACADIPCKAMENTDVLKKAVGEDTLIYEKKGQDTQYLEERKQTKIAEEEEKRKQERGELTKSISQTKEKFSKALKNGNIDKAEKAVSEILETVSRDQKKEQKNNISLIGIEYYEIIRLIC